MNRHTEATHHCQACHIGLAPGIRIAASSSKTVGSNDVDPMGTYRDWACESRRRETRVRFLRLSQPGGVDS